MDLYDFAQHPLLLGLGDEDTTKPTASVPMVYCRVCSAKILLEGYDLEEHYIVKCSQCKEATVNQPYSVHLQTL